MTPFAAALPSNPHDEAAIRTLRRDVEHYRRLYKDLYACAMEMSAVNKQLERQLAETRAELRRYCRERVG